jgi:hypothetical protein
LTGITLKGLDILRRVDPGIRRVEQQLGAALTADGIRELSRLCILLGENHREPFAR